MFENQIISKNDDLNWPPRSCDFMPLNYFLRRAVIDKSYARNIETVQVLKFDTHIAIAKMMPKIIEKTLKN